MTELSKLAGVALTTVSRWEKGETVPGGQHLLKISEILDIPPQEILKNKGGA